MKKTNTNKKFSENSFLEHTKGLTKHHKDYLGLDIPEGYFSNSKKEILASLPKTVKRKAFVIGLKPLYAYAIAASIAIVFGITIWLQNPSLEIKPQITEIEEIDFNILQNDFLITSLLVEDSEIDQFVDNYIINELIVDTGYSEPELENIFLNSIFIEDSLIDSYFEKSIFDSIIL